jgi:hypothetical protein
LEAKARGPAGAKMRFFGRFVFTLSYMSRLRPATSARFGGVLQDMSGIGWLPPFLFRT